MPRAFITAACVSSLLFWAIGAATAQEVVLMAEQATPPPGATLMDVARAHGLALADPADVIGAGEVSAAP